MENPSFQFSQIALDLFVYHGAVNCGVLRNGERALLIDCDDTLTPERLAELGVRDVERIYCTQHRRPNTAGIAAFTAEVSVPLGEERQFSGASAHWRDWHNRWHLYHSRPGPLAPLEDIVVSGTVGGGERIAWGGFTLSVLDTPGMTDGAVSYRVDAPGQPAVIFCGDVLYAAGQVWDVHSLQKNIGGGFSDYHGFLGALTPLVASLEKLAGETVDRLVPSHGPLIDAPAEAARLTARRLEALLRNYAATSALNFYFPQIFQKLSADPLRLKPAEEVDFPDFILPVAATSFTLRSESGALFLIDCGSDGVLDTLNAWKTAGRYGEVEGCWVTHYHDDHVDALHRLATVLPAVPIYADEHMSEILEHPARFFLPCISPAAVSVTPTSGGQTWRWREFELTAFHLPGQTYYHGGLLVRGYGVSALFSGDSFSPSGLDDYTAGNRNFLGAGVGFRHCLDLLRQYQPDFILNQHQGRAFRFSAAQLDTLDEMLVKREKLLAELLPWDDVNYGVDEGWIRAYPYQVDACPGASSVIEVRATEHGGGAHALAVEAVPPPGWSAGASAAVDRLVVHGERIVRARVVVSVPPEAAPGRYPLAFRVTWDGRYLGQICHALVDVC
jgi:glyoxylase-like metal-dependent hydrolase (beta-lactamase superfamily II)